MNPLPPPASRLWEASIRKLKYSTILRGSVVPSGAAFDGAAAAATGGDPVTLTPSLSVSSSTSNTIYQYEDGDDDIDSVLDDVDTDDARRRGVPRRAQPLRPAAGQRKTLPRATWAGDLPHGGRQESLTDRSMYEGSWPRRPRGRGAASSRGRRAPSTEGDLARRAYVNGDVYDGHWRDGLQDGHGRYIWRGGHEYIGTWKAGEMHGRGTVIWADGDRYDGAWEDAKPKGQGTFRWSDGGMYIGLWCQESGETQGKGVYYPPSGGPAVPLPREPKEVITKLLEELEMSEGKTVSLLPSQKVLTWPGVEPVTKKPVWRPPEVAADQGMWRPPEVGADQGRNSMSSDIDSLVEGEDGGEESRNDRSWVRTPSCMRAPTLPKPGKKQGETISKGHKNYELMLNLQLGIRHAVGRQSAPASLDLKSSAFDPKEKVWTRFPPEGSKHTPPHQSCDFRWKDYCPLVFRTLRKLFDVDPGDYMLSICGDDALLELSSPGKSGSFFYFTNDDKYMIKTMKKAEVKVLLRMLPAYYKHVRSFDNTLVTKFFGLHCVKITGAIQKKVRFVIMGNLFCSNYSIHRRFDLKGSSHGRTTDKPIDQIDETTTLKDLDLNFIFRLEGSWYEDFCRQLDKDCEFLEQERIMDYSLLVGVHFKDRCKDSSSPDNETTQTALEDEERRKAPVKLGISMPSRVENVVKNPESESQLIGEPTGEFQDVILFFGIIDILQDYDISKKLEHAYKSMQYDPNSISAVDPKQYCKRFRDFIYRAFSEDLQ
ncbi:hypothetical protein OsJ_32941 [Oryza sativa Japonica Group]|uniref:Phosphatidylinositol 4-phosphate 5-kinase n=1 Tax=Oryza sativa subsp. japonica TaxID=39947 RepID=B9G9D4_ORYSJ|nr:hypothetical protein OsJ_32941 [Oryza sativa Japonica Group]